MSTQTDFPEAFDPPAWWNKPLTDADMDAMAREYAADAAPPELEQFEDEVDL